MAIGSAKNTLCLVCKRTENRVIHRKVAGRNIIKCSSPDCSVYFVNPLPNPAYIKALYNKAYGTGDYAGRNGDYITYGEIAGTKRANFVNYLSRIVPYLTERHPRRLLEIGCATGLFLEEAQKNFDEVHGVDISETGIARAREKFGDNVYCGTLEETNFSSGYFHLIGMWDTMEHLFSPFETLKLCEKLLAQDGILAFTTVNIGSTLAKIQGRTWRHLISEDHITFYDHRSISNLLDRSGFQLLDYRNIGKYVYFKHIIYILNLMLNYKMPRKWLNFMTSLPWRNQVFHINPGDLMFVVACKKNLNLKL